MTTTLPRHRSGIVAMIAALAMILGVACASAQPPPPPAQNLWGGAIPANPALSWDGKSTELGVRFTVTAPGKAIGVRFYRGQGNDGVHKGYLYQGTTKKAEVTFTNETPTGWQEAFFTTPVDLAVGTAYTASYLAPKGHYADDSPMTYPKTSGIIKATGAAYKYGSGGTYPNNNIGDENYYADVIVAPTVAQPTSTTAPPPPTTTTAAPTTTTAAPTTTPPTDPTTPPPTTTATTPPPPPAFPNASNTGVPAGTALTVQNGDLTINTPGTVIDGKDIRGVVIVKANNVTIQNSKVTSNTWAGILNENNSTNLLIEDTEISCSRVGGSSGIASVNYVARRVDIHDCENGLDVGYNVELRDSFIHDLNVNGGDPHTDGIQSWDGSNVTIDHNTIYAYPNPTSAVNINNSANGPTTRNTTISNNLLAGGAYTLYCPIPQTQNFQVLNNRFSTLFYPQVGAFGPHTDCDNETHSGNVYHETGAPVPGLN